jgi:hypothetical protein
VLITDTGYITSGLAVTTFTIVGATLPWTASNTYAFGSATFTPTPLGSFSVTTTSVTGSCIKSMSNPGGYPVAVNYYIPDTTFTITDVTTPIT